MEKTLSQILLLALEEAVVDVSLLSKYDRVRSDVELATKLAMRINHAAEQSHRGISPRCPQFLKLDK